MRPQEITVLGRATRLLSLDGSGDPVVLLHGLGGWAEQWRETMSTLAARGLSAHAVDLPGFGRTRPFADADHFAVERSGYARFVEDLLDVLGLPRAHLVGHSLGGAAAYLAAVTIPQRVASLTLVAAAGIGLDVPPQMRWATLPGMGLLLRMWGRRYARAALASCFVDVSRVPTVMWEEADRYVAPSLGEVVRVLRAGLTLRGVRPDIRDTWASRAERYSGPVLVVWGELDAVLPASGAAEAFKLFPRAEVRLIPDAGHLVMVEQPAAFEAILLSFLDRAGARSDPEPRLPWLG